jgi:hypothetical protein
MKTTGVYVFELRTRHAETEWKVVCDLGPEDPFYLK